LLASKWPGASTGSTRVMVRERASIEEHSTNSHTEAAGQLLVCPGSCRILETKMAEAKSKKDTLKARSASAKTSKQIQEMIGSLDTSNSMVAFDKMEEKVGWAWAWLCARAWGGVLAQAQATIPPAAVCASCGRHCQTSSALLAGSGNILLLDEAASPRGHAMLPLWPSHISTSPCPTN